MLKGEQMKFKDINPEEDFQLDEIQKSIENSCERKIRREEIKRMRRSKDNLKTRFVGKMSGDAKNFSKFRHKIEKKEMFHQHQISRLEETFCPTYKDTMFYQEKKSRYREKHEQNKNLEKQN